MSRQEIIRFGSVQGFAASRSLEDQRYPTHWHDAAEFVLALEDGCVYRVGDNDHRLEAGDLLLIWPRELHELIHKPVGGTIIIQFSAGLLESNRDLAVSTHMLAPLHRLSHAEQPELTERLASMMCQALGIYTSDDFFRETRCKLLVHEMLLLLVEQSSRAKIDNSRFASFSNEAWTRVRQACAYIDAHYIEDLRQSDVAAAVNLSPCYFSRLFRRYVQQSFPEYLARVRVHEAVRLLFGTDRPITECAYQAGFQSITVFNKAFLEITGSTPREYRRLYQSARVNPAHAAEPQHADIINQSVP